MANDTNVRGLYPISGPTGNIKIGYYKANTALAIYRGHPVALNNSGQVAVVVTNSTVSVLGAAVGFLDTNLAGLPSGITGLDKAAYLPAGVDAYVAVTDDPQQLYLVEEDTAGSALTAAKIGQCVGITYQTNSGNATTGYSGMVIDRALVTSGTDGILQLVGVYPKINQDGTANAAGDSCQWVVRIAYHQLGTIRLAVPQA